MAHYAGPPRIRHGSYTDRAAALLQRDALKAQGMNAWLEVERGAGLVLYSVVKPRGKVRPTAENDAWGQCIHCGRDNRGHEGEPCSDDCPLYWEERGVAHPEHQ